MIILQVNELDLLINVKIYVYPIMTIAFLDIKQVKTQNLNNPNTGFESVSFLINPEFT